MTVGEFAELVEKMREAQKEYFKKRTRETLRISKQYEKQVDEQLKARSERLVQNMQPRLFTGQA
jgi:hypothetical protein